MKFFKKYNPTVVTLMLAGIFWLTYTLVVAGCYPNLLRIIEANCWVNDYVLQFFRWPYVGAAIMGGAFTALMLLGAFLLKLVGLKRWMPVTLIIACELAYNYSPDMELKWGHFKLFSEDLEGQEECSKYMLLAEAKDWTGLKLAIIKDDTRNTPIGMRYSLLAESALGTLSETLFTYNITSSEEFLYRGTSGLMENPINKAFYENLEVWDESFHQAQEYAMTQRDWCFISVKNMIDFSIKEAEWSVAEKLLCVLDEALFYHDFVKERRAIIAEGKKVKPMNDAPIRDKNFVSGYSFQNEMYCLYTTKVGNKDKAMEYLLCSILIKKKIEQFVKVFYDLGLYRKEKLPQPYLEAIEIYKSRGTALRDAQPGTYAYYFYNIIIPPVEIPYGSSKTTN